MSDVGYSSVANYANASLGQASRVAGGNSLPGAGVADGGVCVAPNYVRDSLRVLASYGTNAHAYVPGIGVVSGLTAGNYLLSDGSTGLAAVDGPDGLVLDGMGGLGSELAPAIDASWTRDASVTVSGSTFVLTATPGTTNAAYKAVALTVGNTYKAVVSISGFTAGTVAVYLGAQESPTTHTSISANGDFTFYLTPTGAYNGNFAIGTNTGPTTAVITGISIKQVTGIHATAAGAARPTLRRGLYNQFTFGGDVSNAVWGLQATATKSGQSILMPSVGDAVYSASVKAAVGTSTEAFILSGSGTVSIYAWNATDGFIGTTQITLSATPTTYATSFTSTVANTTCYVGRKTAGDTATSVTVAGLGLFTGTLTAAQILAQGGIPLTTSAAASNPNAGSYWCDYAGAQSMALGSVPFQMSDDHCVIAGFNVRVGNTYVFAQPNAAVTAWCGSLSVDASGYPTALWKDDAAATAFINNPVSVLNTATIATAVKISNAKRLRVNGVQPGATNNTVLGATTINNTTIGAYGAGGFTTGSIGPVIVIKGTVSDSDLLTLERWVASLTPNAPAF